MTHPVCNTEKRWEPILNIFSLPFLRKIENVKIKYIVNFILTFPIFVKKGHLKMIKIGSHLFVNVT